MFNVKKIFGLLIFLISNCSATFAVQLPESMKESMAVNTPGLPSLFHLIVSMVVVIAMIYVTGFIYSKLNLVNRSQLKNLVKDDKDRYRFTVLQSLPLGQQRHIYSIEMDGKVFLVGSTPNQISLIKEFDDNVSGVDIVKELNSTAVEQSQDSAVDKIDIGELYKKYKN